MQSAKAKCLLCHRIHLSSLHAYLREVEVELQWQSVVANWARLAFRALFTFFFAYRVFRAELREASGAATYQRWRTVILRAQRAEVLQDIIAAEYEAAELEESHPRGLCPHHIREFQALTSSDQRWRPTRTDQMDTPSED